MSAFAPVKQQIERLARGIDTLSTADEFQQKLERSRAGGQPLIIKVGFDPTAPDIHLGHTVLMQKMRDFQDLGHRVIYVIGDFTASIGDPSGRSKTRPALSDEQIKHNAATYTEQAFKILDRSRTEIRFNSEWLRQLGTDGLVRLSARYTVARMLERRDFRERFDAGIPISVHEFLYPLAQAYDSVELKADVELGGTDQLFNLNVGRDIMTSYGLAPQIVMTVPLLEGTDGVDKMSKSLDNYVGVTESPEQIYGKVMSISDELMFRWIELLTEKSQDEVSAIRAEVESGARHPKQVKSELARLLVARFHDDAAADSAVQQFEQVFANKGLPEQIEAKELSYDDDSVWLARLLVDLTLATSTSQARRLIQQGGVRIDGERVVDDEHQVPSAGEKLVQVGKRRFLRVRFH